MNRLEHQGQRRLASRAKPGACFEVVVIAQRASAAVRREITRAAEWTLRSEGIRQGWLEIAVVGDAVMRRQHARWLGQSRGTDVLAFDLRVRERADLVEGQLIVCRDVARRRTRSRGGEWPVELLLYVVHGCLHLCGHDDERARDAAAMHRREDEILTQLGVGPVFAGGAAPQRTSSPWQKGTGSEPSTLGAVKKCLPRGACPLLPRAARPKR